ncbi:MAG: nucleotidyltransferase domain-containing protein [Rhodospirillales bacterium CG15_BIG_FIL_POST_REV_8_21_14_020_66_15]|nr:MAG: nucleotidyltransferase domain-containing protein [Rhodospirillales bacterium CG15_BIG_FIL_POST_REV_8_21_14_020_66_15]
MPDRAAASGGVAIADFPGRVRTAVRGIVIADSTNVKVLREGGYPAVFYFPPEDVRLAEFLTPTKTRTTCPKKGEAHYWTFRMGAHAEPDIAWAYPAPIPACAAIAGHIAFYWDRMDCWFVGDRQVQAPPA